jgi:hypothetical protein
MHNTDYGPPADGDACEICLGRNGGVPGNENVIDGVVMCDECSAATPKRKECAGCGRKGGIVDALSRRRTYNVVLETVTDCGREMLLCQWCRAKRR